MRFATTFAPLVILLAVSGCQQGPVVTERRPDSDKVTALINGALDKILADLEREAESSFEGTLAISVLELNNKSNTPLGTEMAWFQREVDSRLNRITKSDGERMFVQINREFVTANLREAGIGSDPKKLYIKTNRQRFNELMDAAGNHVNFLVFSELTEVGNASSELGRQFGLYVVVVDATSGRDVTSYQSKTEA